MQTDSSPNRVGKFLSVFKYSRVALQLVWSTSAALTIIMGLTTLVAGILPAAIASVGGYIVDAVVTALNAVGAEQGAAQTQVLYFVLLEAALVVLISAAQRINTVCQSILRVLLGNKINVMILEKSLSLELAHFEDS
ncbi:ABC transporter ATP-binding protein, partial [Haliea sp. AH-315-K21]|nr:ABC transporter ATP-binding protein [Haliea sp. AH-315-K21]